MRTLALLPHPTPTARPTAGPVCDCCRTSRSPAGWRAADDGVQLCERCWLELAGADPPTAQTGE